MTTQHPLILAPELFDHENYTGTCDWGYCGHITVAMRWETNRRRYLSVCAGHALHRDCRDPYCVDVAGAS